MTSNSREQVERLLNSWEYGHKKPGTDPQPGSIWRTLVEFWKRFALMLGRANSILLLSIVYFLLIGPGAMFLKLFRKDLLDRQAEERETYWNEKASQVQDLEQGKHQF